MPWKVTGDSEPSGVSVLGLREVTFKLETKGHPELHVKTDTEQGH